MTLRELLDYTRKVARPTHPAVPSRAEANSAPLAIELVVKDFLLRTLVGIDEKVARLSEEVKNLRGGGLRFRYGSEKSSVDDGRSHCFSGSGCKLDIRSP